MGRPVKNRVHGYAADCTTISHIAVAVKLDARVPAKVGQRIVKKLDEVVLDLAAVTDAINRKK
jgi:hypothetical protein